MKTAVIQLCATDKKKDNINKAVDFVVEAAKKKAKFILLPELFVYRTGTLTSKKIQNISEETSGTIVKLFQAIAKQNDINILLGSIYEKTTSASKAYNTSILIDNKGKVAAKYRKINLFHAKLGKGSIREKDMFFSGSKTSQAEINGFNVGLSVCYDLRFPEIYQKYRRVGVDIITVPSNFTKETGKAHWKTLVQARAIEQLSYVLAPNQVGTNDRGLESYGHSMIVSPWGEILAEASGKREEIIYADLNQKEIKKAREKLPGIIKK